MNKKQIILYTLAVILLLYGIIDMIDYRKNNYDVTRFVFICNPNLCEIRHTKNDGQIKYVHKIDISKIEKFSAKLEKVPRTDKKGYVIYAYCKDGTSFRLSPIYVSPSRYLEEELLNPLNRELKKEQINININFPY